MARRKSVKAQFIDRLARFICEDQTIKAMLVENIATGDDTVPARMARDWAELRRLSNLYSYRLKDDPAKLLAKFLK